MSSIHPFKDLTLVFSLTARLELVKAIQCSAMDQMQESFLDLSIISLIELNRRLSLEFKSFTFKCLCLKYTTKLF